MLKILHIIIVLALGWAAAPALAEGADSLAALQRDWAELKYKHEGEPHREAAAKALEDRAAVLMTNEPNAVAPRVWRAQVLCLAADILHSVASLTKVREARDLLLTAEMLDPKNVGVLTLLGSLYYEVPGWPVGFGDGKKAEVFLRRALAIDPDGRDPNYFMGDFLLQKGKSEVALSYLERAFVAAQQDEPSVDEGRRGEISKAMNEVRAKLKISAGGASLR